jgi:tetratricopeptide (TPR) repeat protein
LEIDQMKNDRSASLFGDLTVLAKALECAVALLFSFFLLLSAHAGNAQQRDEAVLLDRKITQLYNEGRYSEAIPLAQRLLATEERALGPEHPAVANALRNLAILYSEQARFADSEQLYKRALAIQEKALGPNHLDVAITLNNLADLYKNEGRYPEAEGLYKQSLSVREGLLDADHPDIAESLRNLAVLYVIPRSACVSLYREVR